MQKNLKAKTLAIIAILLIFIYGIFGLPKGVSGSALKAALQKNINLGLDLKGGTHLVLQVMVDEAVGAATDSDAGAIQASLAQNGVAGAAVTKPDPKRADVIQISGVAADRSADVNSVLNSSYSARYDIAPGLNNTWTLTLKNQTELDLKQSALDKAIEVINTRINSLGVAEAVVEPYQLGSYQILVELPGVDDPARVREVIQSTARLETHEVMGGPWPDQQTALQAMGAVPPDAVLLQSIPGAAGQTTSSEWYELRRVPVWGGTDIRDATAGNDQNTGEPIVNFYLTNAAGQKFAQFTSANVGKLMAIVLDNRVEEVATIHSEIHDQGYISGGGITAQYAKDLSMLLRTGALPASIEYLQESTIGPSLGADSIHQGVIASIAGMAAVMIFMLIYYRGAGINADLALFLNLVILLGFMGFSNSTLTLPGIAGVILTIGMGVDSNVLIFERIREELRSGKAPSAAVDQGFKHALTTIIDTHVTTIVSAAILFLFGTGPVKGFAVTLTFGLLANFFTSVFVSRVIFDASLSRKLHGEPISI